MRCGHACSHPCCASACKRGACGAGRLALLEGAAAQPPGPEPAPAELRVIVGRGHHSSGGEAALGRVVENELAGAGRRFRRAGGSVLVRLRG